MDDYIDLVIAKLDEDHIVMRAPLEYRKSR